MDPPSQQAQGQNVPVAEMDSQSTSFRRTFGLWWVVIDSAFRPAKRKFRIFRP